MALQMKHLLGLPASLHEDVIARVCVLEARCRLLQQSSRRPRHNSSSSASVHCATTPDRARYGLANRQQRRHYAVESTTRPSSVNADEVAHFNKLASSWWDPQGSSRLLHLMNPLRHRFIQQCFHEAPQGSTAGLSYLDIGCGGGIFAESAARLPSTRLVTAIDPTPEVLRVARRHQRQDPLLMEPGRLNYLDSAIEDLPLPATDDEGYDVVSVFEVVEHIREPAAFLESALQHVKPGGWLVGSTIARTALSWLTTKFIAEEVIQLVPRGTHDWSQYIQPDELQAWARKQALLDSTYTRVMGVVYVPAIGWREIRGSERVGNYFFAFRRAT